MSTSQFIDLDGPVSPAILAGLLDRAPAYLYQEEQKGRIHLKDAEGNPRTYRQVIQEYFDFFRKQTFTKVLKERNEFRLKETKAKLAAASKGKGFSLAGLASADGDEGMHPLMAKKIMQDIRLGRVKEEQALQRLATERNELIALAELVELVEPLVITLRMNLLALADISPEAEKLVDIAMQDIYNIGVKMVENAVSDSKEYVTHMLEREIEFDDV